MPTAPSPDRLPAVVEQTLAYILYQDGVLSEDQLLAAKQYGYEHGIDLRQAILRLKLMSEELLDTFMPENDATPSAEVAAIEASLVAPPTPNRDQLERDIRESLMSLSLAEGHPNLVEGILERGYACRLTDVHFDPTDEGCRVRFRIDGHLHDVLRVDRETGAALVSRMKILAGMNIVEKRHPQDGRITIPMAERKLDLRIATCPTLAGEKVVVRLHEVLTEAHEFEALGLPESQADTLSRLVAQPYGAILVAGPVGAGKTTTLYSCLDRLNLNSRNVMTIEDPVEYRISGVNQIQVDNRGDVGFAEGLRGILRQDPDVLMIGEIRDDETARIGIRAALTGVLVLSSLHASDAAATISNLYNFQIPGYLLSTSLLGIVSQRLMRKICPYCRESLEGDEATAVALGLDPDQHGDLIIARGRGCPACFHTGYLGRIGVFEILEIDDAMRELIFRQGSKEEIRRLAKEHGMRTLHQSAADKVLQRLTTVEEVHRVVVM